MKLGLHAVGVDISEFNVLLSNVKVRKHNLLLIAQKIKDLTAKLKKLQKTSQRVPLTKNCKKN
jgi:hypothetical protein